jgi:hypothetical protein
MGLKIFSTTTCGIDFLCLYYWKPKHTEQQMENFKEKLVELNACSEAIEWVGNKSFTVAWETCERGDWMLWLSKAVEHDKRQRVLAAGHCANLVRHLMTDVHSTNAVDVAILFGEGKATEQDLAYAAASASYAAYAAYAAASASYAASAAYASYAAAAAAAAASSASSASAASAASSASYASARFDIFKKCADICRKYIKLEL